MKLKATPFVSKDGFQIVNAEFVNIGASFDGWYRVSVGGNEPYVKPLGKAIIGQNKKELLITDTNAMLKPTETTLLNVEVFDNPECSGTAKFTFRDEKWERTRHWTFYFCQTMHTDLGYTDPQESLPELYSTYLDSVEDYLKKSDNNEYGETPYKYEIESAWMLNDGFMKVRNADKTKTLVDRVNNGQIDIAAGRFNYTMECFGTEETARAAYYTNRYLVDKLGVKPSKMIRMFDNPAFSKSFIDVAASAGIKYGLHSMNPDRSPYHKKRLYDIFYMQGFKKENKLLVFNGKSYGDCYGFGGTYWTPNDGKLECAEKNVNELIKKLEGKKDYPYDKFPMPLIPIGDNKPPLEQQIKIANELNGKWQSNGYAFPKIVAAFPDKFFEDLEEEYGEYIPIETGTEENWWNDGWGTAAYESGMNKEAGALIPNAETLASINMALGDAKYPYEDLYEASQRNIVYDEHTFGNNLYDDSSRYHGQFEWKRSNAIGAMGLAKKCQGEAMQNIANTLGGKSEIVVFNSFSNERTDVVTVEDVSSLPAYFKLFDGETEIPYVLKNGVLSFIAENVPALGYKNFKITETEIYEALPHKCVCGNDFIENKYYKVTFATDGTIKSITDKENGRELVDTKATEGFNQYRYYDDFGIAFVNMDKPFGKDRWSMYTPLAKDTSLHVETTPISAFLQARTKTFRAGDIRQTVTLYNDIKRIDIKNEVLKEAVPTLKSKEEAFYTFPFNAKNHEITYGLPIGTAKEGEQVYGTSTDWYTVNGFIGVSDKNDGYDMILSVPNAILAQFGERRTGKWSFDYVSKKPYIYSYVFNNMWWTNFQGDQSGLAEFKYSIFSGSDILNSAAKLSDEKAVPMTATISAGAKKKTAVSEFAKIDCENVALSVIKTAESNGDGMIIRFCEKYGKDADGVTVTLPENFVSYNETDVIENDIGKKRSGNVICFSVPAYGVKTFRIISDKKMKKAKITSAVSDSRGTLLTWKDVDGAGYYEIFRSSESDTEKRWVASTSKNSFRDVQVDSDISEKYTYYVRACSTGKKGALSAGVTPTAGENSCVCVPTVLSAVPRTKNRIDLMWLPDCSGDVKNYEIYRNGRKIGETVDSYVCSFRDKTAAYPEYYTYKVASVTFNGEKVFSNELPVRHNDLRFSHSEHSSVKNAKRNPFRIFYKPNKLQTDK